MSLVEVRRLIIHGQVAREFAKQKANKISELYQQLSAKRDGTQNIKKGLYPLLDSLDTYQQSLELEEKINILIKEYRDTLNKVLAHIQNWVWNDPVSLLYGELFTEGVVLDIDYDEAEVKKNWRIGSSIIFRRATKIRGQVTC